MPEPTLPMKTRFTVRRSDFEIATRLLPESEDLGIIRNSYLNDSVRDRGDATPFLKQGLQAASRQSCR